MMYNYEVLNAGVQGASPIYYALNSTRYIDLKPDTIVLLLYENDLWEDRVRELNYEALPSFYDTKKIMSNYNDSFFLVILFLFRKLKTC